jgi:hypothetical protein
VHRGSRPRGFFASRGRAGVASTVVPMLIGVILAFVWNVAGTHGLEMPQAGPALAPTVGTAVDQAVDQAWASATPASTRFPDRRPSSSAGSRRLAGTRCHQARSSRTVRAASWSLLDGTLRAAPCHALVRSAAMAQRHSDSPGADHLRILQAIEDHANQAADNGVAARRSFAAPLG